MEKIYQVEDKKKYIDLLLLADESLAMIDSYLNDCTMFVIDDNGVKGEINVMAIDNKVLEIKNLAVASQSQKMGYGKKLIEYVCNLYKDKFEYIQVGTGDSPITIPFYQKCGFEKSHIIQDFFITNYDHPIYEEGIQLIDMVYLIKKI